MEETLLHMEKSTTIQGKLSQYSLHAFTKNIKLKPTQMKLYLTGSPKFEKLASAAWNQLPVEICFIKTKIL